MIDQLQRVAIAVTLGLVLMAMGLGIDTWEFWSIVALLLCSNRLNYIQGVEQGVVSTMDMVADLTDTQRVELMAMVRQVPEED